MTTRRSYRSLFLSSFDRHLACPREHEAMATWGRLRWHTLRRSIMQRVASPFTSSIVFAVAVVALLVTSALASARPSHLDRVEVRIHELRMQLQITSAQESLWNNITQVMRDNARTMDALTQARAVKAQTMTAVDDLKTYTDIVEAHAEGLKKF